MKKKLKLTRQSFENIVSLLPRPTLDALAIETNVGEKKDVQFRSWTDMIAEKAFNSEIIKQKIADKYPYLFSDYESTIRKFNFNTGVRLFDHNPPAGMAFMKGFKDSGNGVYVIPFECKDVPDDAVFAFSCDVPNLPNHENFIVREIHNTVLLSKYAYFKP